MEEREKVVCLAKLAEQAERYDGKESRCLFAALSFLVPLHLGKSVCALFFVGKELGIVALRSGAFASVFAYLLQGLKSEQQPTGSEFFFGFLPCWSKNPLNLNV